MQPRKKTVVRFAIKKAEKARERRFVQRNNN